MNTDLVLFEGQSTYGYWDMPKVLTATIDPADTIAVQITPDLVGRPDLIAEKYYGNSEFDWLVIAYNAQTDPTALDVFGWPKVGTVITIPSPYIVNTMLR